MISQVNHICIVPTFDMVGIPFPKERLFNQSVSYINQSVSYFSVIPEISSIVHCCLFVSNLPIYINISLFPVCIPNLPIYFNISLFPACIPNLPTYLFCK
uniref:Uncharacterized protein n=1 Tax=Cacopsylla melanoneura TaxID=428564 RepID=A0A8D8T2C8_9HEMI